MLRSLAVDRRYRLALLNAADAPGTAQVVAELPAADGASASPPEWVRLLAAGVNKARDGRSFTVGDVDQVVARSLQYKGSIDLLLDFEHQFDRAPNNGKPAPAAGWITDLAAEGPDGTPGIWAKVRWVPETVALIREQKYRYLSAVVATNKDSEVVYVARASLTNHPALDTATALFSADVTAVVPLNVHQAALDQLAASNERHKAILLDEASRAGKLPPSLRAFAAKLSPELLTEYLSAAPVIVTPGVFPATVNLATPAQAGAFTIETLSAEHKAEAKRFGVSEEAYCVALNAQANRG